MPRTKKNGGAMVDDLKMLAVPFALLLAKEGLDKSKSKKTPKSKTKTMSPKSAKSPSSPRRKTTLAGGSVTQSGGCHSCNLPMGPSMSGGSSKTGGRMKKLTKDIDMFLKKY